jgi:hypothetical protein
MPRLSSGGTPHFAPYFLWRQSGSHFLRFRPILQATTGRDSSASRSFGMKVSEMNKSSTALKCTYVRGRAIALRGEQFHYRKSFQK